MCAPARATYYYYLFYYCLLDFTPVGHEFGLGTCTE
jgi:hypothetical protein